METDLYVNDFKSALNRIPKGSYMSDYDYSVLNDALEKLPVKRKDFMAFNTAVVPTGELLMRELEKNRGN